MRRFILSGSFVFFLGCAVLSAESCKVTVADLTAKIRANPGSVHVLLGDAIVQKPDCIGELFEAALLAAKPDDDTLAQLIKMAVSQYPEESAKIAEIVLASSEQGDMFRTAFSAAREAIVATPVEVPNEVDPIEKLRMAFRANRPFDPEDLADNALLAIGQLLEQMEPKEERGVTFSGDSVEEIKVSVADDSVHVSTLGNAYRDRTEELLPVLVEPLVFQDPVEETQEQSSVRSFDKVSQKAVHTPSLAKPRETITSSAYRERSADQAGDGGKDTVTGAAPATPADSR